MKQSRTQKTIYTLLNIIVLIIFLFPFLWMLSASFKTQIQVLSPDYLFTFTPTIKNYVAVFTKYDYLQFIWNTFLIAALSTFGSLFLGLPAAYGVAKYKMPFFGFTVLVAKIIPGITYLVPWYILFNKMHLIDTFTGMVLAHMVIGMPFIMWVMIPFFEEFPKEVEESAWIDGSSKLRTFYQMVLPISMPGIITSSLLSFIFSWNNFMFSLVLAGEKTKTLPLAIFNFMSNTSINWGALMAAACIITLPVIVIAVVAQKYVVSGLSAGAVKG